MAAGPTCRCCGRPFAEPPKLYGFTVNEDGYTEYVGAFVSETAKRIRLEVVDALMLMCGQWAPSGELRDFPPGSVRLFNDRDACVTAAGRLAAKDADYNRLSDAAEECRAWLADRLADAPQPVRDVRREAEARGFSVRTLYEAVGGMGLVESGSRGRAYWALPNGFPGREGRP